MEQITRMDRVRSERLGDTGDTGGAGKLVACSGPPSLLLDGANGDCDERSHLPPWDRPRLLAGSV